MHINVDGPCFVKAAMCTPILRSLPDWFGIESALVHYAAEIDVLPTFLALEAGNLIGFLSSKQHPSSSAEVYVMAVLQKAHRKGVGRTLISSSQEWLKSRGVQYLQVKH